MCPGKAHSLHGTPSRVSAWKEARGGTLHLPTQTLLTSMEAEPSPALQSPELLGPHPLGQQSAACPCASPHMASSSSSSTSSGTFALGPWGRITSQGICGWPGQGFSANVSTSPPARERWGPIGRARGSQASGVPKAGGGRRGGVGIVRSSCSFGTHMASPFSLPGRRCCVRGRAAGGRGPGAGGGWERVLCWDEALYPHIFLWEREPGSSVALPPSVASSAQGPSAFCLPFPSP